jgi:hypothetical protein
MESASSKMKNWCRPHYLDAAASRTGGLVGVMSVEMQVGDGVSWAKQAT